MTHSKHSLAACISEGDFQLRHGGASRVYLDASEAWKSHILEAAAKELNDLVWTRFPRVPRVEAVCGVPTGGNPWATAFVAHAAGLRLLVDRGDGRVEGPPPLRGGSVVLIEDVCTTGKSTLNCVRRLQDANYRVGGVLVLVDRGGCQWLRQRVDSEFRIEPLFTLSELL